MARTTHAVAKTLGDLDLLEFEVTQRFSKLCLLPRLSSTSSSIFSLIQNIMVRQTGMPLLYELGLQENDCNY